LIDVARTRRRTRVRTGAALVWFSLSTVLLIAPVFPWLGNRIEPRVAGLPWSLVWVLGVVALNFAALAWLYATRSIDDAELDDD
jgi:drug/metabolite transporter (DMT)-like permease